MGGRGFGLRRWAGAIALSCGLAFAAFPAGSSHAEQYPSKVIRLICPFPVGVSTDVLARGLAQELSDSLGQSVVVENRPGANGMIAATAVAKAPADGYTFLITTGSHVANAHVMKDLSYHPLKDFAPITQLVASHGLALITALPVNSIEELVALAKEKKGELSYAHSGQGNLTHVAARLFEERAGVELIAVPYNNPNLVPDVIAGRVSMSFISTVSAVPMVKAGQVKALAITGPTRTPSLPDTPTLVELGYKDYNLIGYFGTLFPAGTPPDRIERVYQATAKALASPKLKKLIEDSGLYAVGSTPAEFADYLKRDYDYQDKLMEELDLKPK